MSAAEEAPGDSEDLPSCWCEELGDVGYICCIFECPGWEDYLGHIEDTVEMAIGDIDLPGWPDYEQPDVPDFDDKELPAPTTTEDPGLGDASFDAAELKSGEEIEFREDPSGGFDIINPVDNLESLEGQAPNPEMGEAEQPTPTQGNSNGMAEQPSYDDSAQQPSYSDSAAQPSYNDSVEIPIYVP